MAEDKPAFTPGPWRLYFEHPTPDYEFPYMRLHAGDGGGDSGFHIAGIVSESDAHLIAAAPEMLAALNAAAGHLLNAKIDLETGAPKRTAVNTIEGGLKIIHAAIAKAGGQS